MKKKKHLFPKVSLMSCLLLTAMPLQTAFADSTDISVIPLIGEQVGLLPVLPGTGIHAQEYNKMTDAYIENLVSLINQKVKPFLVNEPKGYQSFEAVNEEINSIVSELKNEGMSLQNIHHMFKQSIQNLATRIGYRSFMQDAMYLENFERLTIPELDEAYVDLLVNYEVKHRILVKYEDKVKGRAPLEAFIVPLSNRIRSMNEIAAEVNYLPEAHEDFLVSDSSEYNDKLNNINFALGLGVSEFIDYNRLENMMEKEIHPLYLELYAMRRNRQIQVVRDVYPNLERANAVVESLKTIKDIKQREKKLQELLEIYIQRSGDVRKPDVLQRFIGKYQSVVDEEKNKLQDYLESDIFDSYSVDGEKIRNKEITLINRDAYLSMIYRAQSISEIKTIRADLESLVKSFQNEESDSKVEPESPVKVEKPVDKEKPKDQKKPVDQSKPESNSKEGWIKKDNKWFYIEKSGGMATGWKKVGDKWYYLDNTGAMVTGWKKVANKWYYLENSGAMATGWKKVSNKWYYLENSGAMATGWKRVSNKWYYLENSGAMATGWKKVANKWYYLENSGAMATGWKKVSNKWYYLENSGAMATGWKKIANKWYYLDKSGMMVTGSKSIDGKKYAFKNDGSLK
uniref:SpaA n=1 Tax=Erysipelothrix rhusiopathiae TaxID=1648 RepID=A0A0P0HZK1_ERYRH|nr:SpaA [Erysipelothrix rhusiopathiae]